MLKINETDLQNLRKILWSNSFPFTVWNFFMKSRKPPPKKGNFTLLHPPFLFYPEISGNRRKNGCRVSNRIEIRDKKGQKLRRLIGEGWRRLPSNSAPSKGPETSFRVEFLDRLTVDSRSWLSNQRLKSEIIRPRGLL